MPGRRCDANAAGANVEYKRTLLEKMRSAHTQEEMVRMEHALTLTRLGHQAAARVLIGGASAQRALARRRAVGQRRSAGSARV